MGDHRRLIKVQSKSGSSFIVENTDAGFSTPVKKEDLEYWYKCTYPVLFIVYHPGEDKLYFKEVKSYVRSKPNIWQRPYKIVFDNPPTCSTRIAVIASAPSPTSAPARLLSGERAPLFQPPPRQAAPQGDLLRPHEPPDKRVHTR